MVGGAGRNGRRAHESHGTRRLGLGCQSGPRLPGNAAGDWLPAPAVDPLTPSSVFLCWAVTDMLKSENKASAAASSWLEALCTRCTMFPFVTEDAASSELVATRKDGDVFQRTRL
jgi:hypothetical protein